MPHLILEHSNNLPDQINYREFFKEAHLLFVELGALPDTKSLKSRYIKADEYFLSDEKAIFIHLSVALLKGRSKEKLQALGKSLQILLQKHFTKSCLLDPNAFTVEIRELDNEIYFK